MNAALDWLMLLLGALDWLMLLLGAMVGMIALGAIGGWIAGRIRRR